MNHINIFPNRESRTAQETAQEQRIHTIQAVFKGVRMENNYLNKGTFHMETPNWNPSLF